MPAKPPPKPAPLGEFEHIVLLALLRLGDEAYGMLVRQTIQELIKRDISIGAIYTTLDRLQAKGLVESRTGEATARRGGRAKKYYAVTGRGRAALREARDSLQVLWEGVQLNIPATAHRGGLIWE